MNGKRLVSDKIDAFTIVEGESPITTQYTRRAQIHSAEPKKVRHNRYITGLDGLRALAVVGVILFHLMPSTVPGGWLGVPLFFVLSGYLITDLLIKEYDDTGHIRVGSFWLRRIRRLYPALVTMLVLTSLVIIFWAPSLLYNLRYNVLSNLAYVYNYWAMAHGQSYFDQFGGASPFTHLWSLSIEGQFYLFWPFIVLLLLKTRLRRGFVTLLLTLAAGGSALLMALLYQPENINRAYYGTDTRMFALLLGAALAFCWPASHLSNRLNLEMRSYLNIIGFIAILDTLLGFMVMGGQKIFTYQVGMFAMTLIMTVLVAVVAHPSSWFSHGLNKKILNYVGQRSYSIYLYQLPVFVFYEKFLPHYHFTWLNALVEVILVFVLSEISYRYVEALFRKPARLKAALIKLWGQPVRAFVLLGLLMILLFTLVINLARPQAGMAAPKTHLQKQLESNEAKIAANNKKAKSKQSAVQANQPLTSQQKALIASYGITEAQYRAFSQMDITAIGDSVMLDAAPSLQELNSKVVVNAQVGRQATDAINDLISQINSQGISSRLVIGLGTNGDIKESDIERLMAALPKNEKVYWANNYVVSKPWMTTNNQLLEKEAKKYSNFYVVDWADLVAGHGDWLASDGVHPGPTGNLNYTRAIVAKMTE
ncbi:acyltransferase family protein [Eupransor demetentiae]|uniref:Contains acyltransferase and SGNH-hydrolase domains (OafA) n=1 Tax=Eupransor demetentiae TaxID=3109584 RepID=A0ABP0EMQ4_9LACO|nr:Peptidoglycan/LPS O-acetylase OafA/YrhL [Lactobacillaceae bacterium LMG 33000]